MPANIEQINGKALFVSGRGEPGWHRLGETVQGLMTMEEVLDRAHLSGWNVHLEPLQHKSGKEIISVEGQNIVVRTNPITGEREGLAVVGDRYVPHQNEEAFEFTENIIALGGARWDTAGSLDGGRRVFGTLVVPSEFVLDPQGAADRVETYLGVATSHDGTMPITSFMTPTRVVCQNTLTIALRGNKRVYKVRHTKNAEGRLEDARQALRVAYAYFGQMEKEAWDLYQTSITNKEFDKIVATLFPVPEEVVKDGKVTNQAAITRVQNTVDFVHDLYREAGTLDNIRGTAWGAYNAITEYVDWYRPTRGDNKNENLLVAQLGLSDDKAKTEALSAVKELVGVN